MRQVHGYEDGSGAVCFFVGALLLLPERTEEVSDAVTTAAASGA